MPEFDNPELVQGLTSHFIRRNEPNVAWGMSVGGRILLPQLRGTWPMSSVDENLLVYDQSEQARHLTDNGTVTYGVQGLCPYATFNGSTEYLTRADEAGLSITAGLTLGGWFWFDDEADANPDFCMGKWDESAVNDRSYQIRRHTTGIIRFSVSANGAAQFDVDSTLVPSVETWYFFAGRYTPSSEIKLWINLNTYTNVASIPAAIDDNASDFSIAANNTAGGYANFLSGRCTLAWLCAAALPDVVVQTLYHWSRAMFNVV